MYVPILSSVLIHVCVSVSVLVHSLFDWLADLRVFFSCVSCQLSQIFSWSGVLVDWSLFNKFNKSSYCI